MDEEDVIMPEEELDTPVETPEADTTEQVNQPEPEDEDKKFLDYVNGKNLIKFNGENVAIKDLNDLVTNYQKGLNYDKHNADDQFVLDFIKDSASKINVNSREYITRVQNYQKEQEQKKREEAQERDIQKYINEGLSEEVARDIVEAKLAKEELEKERAEYQKRIAEEEKKAKEDAEYIDFIKAHPELKIDEIPQEVFESSKEIGITAAYNQYENKMLKEKIKQMEQNIKNASSSPVGLTSDGSTTEQQSKDAFLEGFDSVI